METKIYLIVQNNVVTNSVLWNGDSNTWQPPADAVMLVQSEVNALVWQPDVESKEYVLVEQTGAGTIGFTWDGSILTTGEPKPEYVEPSTGE